MRDKIFKASVYIFTLLSMSLLIIIILFVYKQAHPFFMKYSLIEFFTGKDWNAMETRQSYQIFPILSASLYISILSCIISFPVALGISLYISFYASDKIRRALLWISTMLSGIPSIIYGFFALLVIVKGFEKFLKMAAGESVLAGAFILAIMILPFFVSGFVGSIDILKSEYLRDSESLGISKEYFIYKVVLRNMRFPIITGFLLALARAMGETMAIMMVIGNAPIMPKLLSKAQTIPSLIALEIGMSEVGSLHYSALFAAAFTLIFLVLIINIIFFIIVEKREKRL